MNWLAGWKSFFATWGIDFSQKSCWIYSFYSLFMLNLIVFEVYLFSVAWTKSIFQWLTRLPRRKRTKSTCSTKSSIPHNMWVGSSEYDRMMSYFAAHHRCRPIQLASQLEQPGIRDQDKGLRRRHQGTWHCCQQTLSCSWSLVYSQINNAFFMKRREYNFHLIQTYWSVK